MSVAIGLGLMDFPFAGAVDYWRWVDLCEAGGVDSIWQTDRLVSRQPILECMAAMAALAGRTRRLRFGMNVVSLALRDPVLLAKQCATIDVLSEGRLLPAFGIGSPLGPEWQALDIDTRRAASGPTRRWRSSPACGARTASTSQGAHYRLRGAAISPKPVQPDLPMWIGGASDAAIRRTARYGTGWQAGGETPADAGKVVAAIKKARRPGRPHASTRTTTARVSRSTSAAPATLRSRRAMQAYAKRTGRDSRRYFAIGDETAILDRIGEYVAAGVEKFILRPVGPDIMGQTKRLIERVLPLVEVHWPKKMAKAS